MEDSLRISDRGLQVVEQARKRRGWNRQSLAWCRAALTSLASLKQFWRRRRIQKDSFIRICEAVGVHNWQEIIEQDLSGSQLIDWGNAPDPIDLWGREADLETLEAWVRKEQGRVISLFGMSGIGKTALGVELVHRLQDRFDRIIWRSAQEFPNSEALLQDLIATLSEQSHPGEDFAFNQQLQRFQGYLREHRCLILLDDLDLEHQKYEDILKIFGRGRHTSCLITIGLEKLSESLISSHRQVKCYPLAGLSNAASDQLLEDTATVFGSQTERSQLIQYYGGHPVALRLAALTIQEFFSCDISAFLAVIRQGGFPLVDLIPRIEKSLCSLSPSERLVLHQLAFTSEPLTILDLRQILSFPSCCWQLPFTLQTLQRRALLQITPQGFQLLPMIAEHLIYLSIGETHQSA